MLEYIVLVKEEDALAPISAEYVDAVSLLELTYF